MNPVPNLSPPGPPKTREFGAWIVDSYAGSHMVTSFGLKDLKNEKGKPVSNSVYLPVWVPQEGSPIRQARILELENVVQVTDQTRPEPVDRRHRISRMVLEAEGNRMEETFVPRGKDIRRWRNVASKQVVLEAFKEYNSWVVRPLTQADQAQYLGWEVPRN